jgi:hypothetical protein
MFITTSSTSACYKAAVRSSADHRVLYTATNTMGEEQAARAVVRKYWTEAASKSVREITEAEECRLAIGDFMRSAQRKQVFRIWAFNPSAK